MRLWVFSDLHLEFEWTDRGHVGGLPEADVCVVAGDLKGSCAEAVHWLERMVGRSGMPCVFAPGNHEFYRNSILEGLEAGRHAAAQFPNVHLLDNDTVVLNGVRFLGCTLWTDYALDGDEAFATAVASFQLNDHRKVAWRALPEREPFTPRRAKQLHKRARAWLEAELAKPFDGPTVVVTHHAPHPLSVNRRFEGSALNPAFASDLSEVIERWRPALWVHGHMHDSCDYMVGDTRVLCNPAGYGNENPRFNPRLVVEV